MKTTHKPTPHVSVHKTAPNDIPVVALPAPEDLRPRLEALEKKVEELMKREPPPAQVILQGNS